MTFTLPTRIVRYFDGGANPAEAGFYRYEFESTSNDYTRQNIIPANDTTLLGGKDTFEIRGVLPDGTAFGGHGDADTYFIRDGFSGKIEIHDPLEGDDGTGNNLPNKIIFDNDVSVTSVAERGVPVPGSTTANEFLVTMSDNTSIRINGIESFEFIVQGGSALSHTQFFAEFRGGFSGDNNNPRFQNLPTGLTLSESADGSGAPVEIVPSLEATDNDGHTPLVFSITLALDQNLDEINIDDHFAIDPSSGRITYTGSGLDAETITSVALTIVVTDSRNARSERTLDIEITDDNSEHQAVFSVSGVQTLAENADGTTAPVPVATATATDADRTDSITGYALVSASRDGNDLTSDFSIDETSGVISYTGDGSGLDAESGSNSPITITLTATTTNTVDGTTRASASYDVTITIVDADDNPIDFGNSPTTATLQENQSGAASAITLATITASDADQSVRDVSYAITSAQNNGGLDFANQFAIHPTNGEITYIGTGLDADAPDNAQITITITATTNHDDGNGGTTSSSTATHELVVTIGDLLDEDLTLASQTQPIRVNESETPGFVITTIGEATPDLTTSTISYRLLTSADNDVPNSLDYSDGDEFNFNSTSRELSVKNALNHGSDGGRSNYQLTIRITETSGAGTTQSPTVTRSIDHVVQIEVTDVADAPPTFTHAAQAGTPTTADLSESSAAGAMVFNAVATPDIPGASISYSITDGDNYVSVNAGGQITLDDAVDAETLPSFTFTVRADDGTRTSDLTVTVNVDDVNDVAPRIVASSISIQAAGSVALTQDNLAATDADRTATPATALTYTLEALPAAGVSVSLSGTALAVGSTFTQDDVNKGLVSLNITSTDTLGGLRFSLSDGQNPISAFDFDISINSRAIATISTPRQANDVDISTETGDFTIDTGDGNDIITAGHGNDVITAGLGDDIINLDGDGNGGTTGGRDEVVYNFGSGSIYSAADGGDIITNFKRGEDVFVLRTTSADPNFHALTQEQFLSSLSGTEEGTRDDQMVVTPEWIKEPNTTDPNVDFDYFVTGILLHFQRTGTYGEGRLASGVIEIGFDERITWDAFTSLIEITDAQGNADENFDYTRGVIKDLTVLPRLLGEGSLSFETSLPPPATLTLSSDAGTRAEGEVASQTMLATLSLANAEGYGAPEVDDSRFEIINGNELVIKAGSVLDFETEPTLTLTIFATLPSNGHRIEDQFTLTLTDENDAPIGTNTSVNFTRGEPYGFIRDDFDFSDPDGQTVSTIRIASLPSEGQLTFEDNRVFADSDIPVASLTDLIFLLSTPTSNAAYSVSFTYLALDPQGGSASAPITMTINIPAATSPTQADETANHGSKSLVDTGDDLSTKTLEDGKDVVVYTFASTEGGWIPTQAKTINSFEAGEDVLYLGDIDDASPATLADFTNDNLDVSVKVENGKVVAVAFDFDEDGTDDLTVNLKGENLADSSGIDRGDLATEQFSHLADFFGGGGNLIVGDEDDVPQSAEII